MKTTRPHGHRNPNQSRAETRETQPSTSLKKVGHHKAVAPKLGAGREHAGRPRASETPGNPGTSVAPAEQAHTVTLSLTGPEWRNLCRAAAALRAKPHEFAHLATTDYAHDVLRDETLAFAVLNGIVDRFDGQ